MGWDGRERAARAAAERDEVKPEGEDEGSEVTSGRGRRERKRNWRTMSRAMGRVVRRAMM